MRRLLAEKGSLAGLASRALGWSFFSTAFGRLGQMGFNVLLARLLGPREFGTAAVAYVALLAILSFNELGVSLAIVRWPDEPDKVAPTVSTISAGTSLLLYVGMYFGAPAFAHAMGAPAATSVVRVLALTVVISGFVSVPDALLQRNFRQDRKMIADQVHGWLSTLSSVGLAFAGFGAMSLSLGQVIGGVVGAILTIAFSPLRFTFGFDRVLARRLLKFGLPLAGSSFVVFLVTNVDNLTVGHLLGATALGYYVLAWNLASWPVNMFSQPVRNVAPAMFSRLQRTPDAMRKSFSSAAVLLGAVTLPICLLISGAAVPLIAFVYNSSWAPAARALVWLAMLGALRILFELTYDYFVVLARSRVVLTVQVAWLLALVPALIAGARLDGIEGVGIAGVAVAAGVVLPWYLVELSRAGIRVRALAGRYVLPIAVGVAVGVAARVLARFIADPFLACAAAGTVALVAVALLMYCMRPSLRLLRASLNTREDQAEAVVADSAVDEAADGLIPGGRAARRDRPVPAADPAAQAAGLQALLSLAKPARDQAGLVGPLHSLRESTGRLPVYRDVVTSLQWEPSRPDDKQTRSPPDQPLPPRPHRHAASGGRLGSGQTGRAESDLPGRAEITDVDLPEPDPRSADLPTDSAER